METRILFGMYNERRMWLPMPTNRPEKPQLGLQKHDVSLLSGSSDLASPFRWLHIFSLSLDTFLPSRTI